MAWFPDRYTVVICSEKALLITFSFYKNNLKSNHNNESVSDFVIWLLKLKHSCFFLSAVSSSTVKAQMSQWGHLGRHSPVVGGDSARLPGCVLPPSSWPFYNFFFFLLWYCSWLDRRYIGNCNAFMNSNTNYIKPLQWHLLEDRRTVTTPFPGMQLSAVMIRLWILAAAFQDSTTNSRA